MNQQYAKSAEFVHAEELNSKRTHCVNREAEQMQIAARTIPKPALAAFNHALSPLGLVSKRHRLNC
jgi:hypothetical protein